jgi:5'-3' exonuclease
MQFLTGDRIDNIIGVKGIGAVKAKKLLEGKTEREMYEICVEKLGSEERAIENGILLWLRRHEGQIWTPPTKEEVNDKENKEEHSEGV